MGGAIACKTIRHYEFNTSGSETAKSIQGFIMIDVTEESATSALPFMQDVISNRPSEFSDLTAAISYGVQSKQVKDKRSACVSMPA